MDLQVLYYMYFWFVYCVHKDKHISAASAQLQLWHFTESLLQGAQENVQDYSIKFGLKIPLYVAI